MLAASNTGLLPLLWRCCLLWWMEDWGTERVQCLDGVCLQGQLNLLSLEQHTQVCWPSLFPSISPAGINRIYMSAGEKKSCKGTWNSCQCVSVTGLCSDEQKQWKDDPRITRLQVVPGHHRKWVPKALPGASCCYRLRRTHRVISPIPMWCTALLPENRAHVGGLVPSSSLTHWPLLSCSCLQSGPTSRRSVPRIEQMRLFVLGRVSLGCPWGPSPSVHFPEVMSWKKSSFYRKLCKGATQVLWFCLCIPKYTSFFLILYDLHLPYKNKLSAGE